MYMLAGYVAEVLEGEDWERMNTQRLFTPLGMDSSVYVRDITENSNLAQAYTLLNNTFVKVGTTTLQ
jgi:CubicO group peptidase (beta-lactamase class C family)